MVNFPAVFLKMRFSQRLGQGTYRPGSLTLWVSPFIIVMAPAIVFPGARYIYSEGQIQ